MNKIKLSSTAQKIYDELIENIKQENTNLIIGGVRRLAERLARFEDAMQYNEYSQEYTNENYRCTRNPYYSIETDDIKYGYTVYKWTGATKTMPSIFEGIAKKTNDPELKALAKKTYQVKEWREILHYTSDERKEMNKEYLEEELKALEVLKKGWKKRNGQESKD